jgi:hypothetical protein
VSEDEPLLGPDALRLVAAADRVAGAIVQGEPQRRMFAAWLLIARAIWTARVAISERHGGRGGHLGRPWRTWLPAHPGLAALPEAVRSHAAWLGANEEEVRRWREGLPPRRQMALNHPATLRAGFERDQREQAIVRATGAKRVDERRARVRAEQAIAALSGQVAALADRVRILECEVASMRQGSGLAMAAE